jgi:hypothetical protein
MLSRATGLSLMSIGGGAVEWTPNQYPVALGTPALAPRELYVTKRPSLNRIRLQLAYKWSATSCSSASSGRYTYGPFDEASHQLLWNGPAGCRRPRRSFA